MRQRTPNVQPSVVAIVEEKGGVGVHGSGRVAILRSQADVTMASVL